MEAPGFPVAPGFHRPPSTPEPSSVRPEVPGFHVRL